MNDRIDPPGAESEGTPPEGAGLSVDEKFARLVAELGGTGAGAPAPKEEAARTRALRAEWSRKPPQATGWRTDGPPSAVPPYPDPAAKADLRKKRGGWVKWVAITSAVIVLVGVVASIQSSSSPGASPLPLPSPSLSVSYANPDDAYFAGSPALDWRENEAGFSIPRAVETNGVSSDDITTGYQSLEKLMEAGNLDPTVLDGSSTSDFSSLLDPRSEMTSVLATDLARPSYLHDPTDLVTRFDPKTTRLLGHTVKVSGSMSAAAGPYPDTALLTANYLFAYAVGPASGDASEDGRTVVHRTVQVEVFSSDSGYEYTPGKVWIYQYNMSVGNDQCYDYNGYFNPEFTYQQAAPNETGTLDPYATGNLLVPSNSAIPTPTSTEPGCEVGATT